MKNMFSFKIVSKDKKSKARVGRIRTPHGVIDTPAFVPVGTQATVKSLTPQDLREIGVQIFFGNTYHLHLRPGEDVIKDFGGLGKFMGWNGATMTDSGGFQVFSFGKGQDSPHPLNDSSKPSGNTQLVNEKVSTSTAAWLSNSGNKRTMKSVFRGKARPFIGAMSGLDIEEKEAALVKITENGVIFRSHLDGSLHDFTPEKSIEIQKKLGADIILAFDECAPYPSSYEYAKGAMERTHRWAQRSLAEFKIQNSKFKINTGQALYGIVQGGIYKDLREESAKFISKIDFDGIAIGGVAVGESKKEMRDVLDWTIPLLPQDKPRHLLGVGEIDDIFEIIERGVDMFDCVIPTRLGRTGFILVSPPEGNLKNRFRIDINKSRSAKDQRPLAKNCACYSCQNFTRAYIHHLFDVHELLAYRLATYHNLYFINNLVRQIREAILKDRFDRLKKQWI